MWVLGIVALFALGLFVYIQRRPLLERYWIWKLETGEKGDKRRAAEKLGEMRSLAAMPSLVAAFRESPGSPAILSEFGIALTDIGPPAVDPLLGLIDLENVRLCECIAGAMLRMGLEEYTTFLERVRSQEAHNPGLAVDLDLGLMDSTWDALMAGTADQRSLAVWATGRTARMFWSGKAGFDTLQQKGLDEVAQDIFREALAPYAKLEAPRLIVALNDESPGVRREAARALGSLRWLAGPEAVDALTGLADDPDMSVRQAAIAALEEIRRSAPNAEGSASEGSDTESAGPSGGSGPSNQ